MFHLLQPIWLFAMAGIIIPVLIHLWNQEPGKILKIGSIVLLTESSKQYARSLRLNELLLLLMRCLLIILLALVLSTPQWLQPFSSAKQKGWVLADKQNLARVYTHFKPVIDSLIKAGFEFHDFNTGFKKEKLEEALKSSADTAGKNSVSYWSLVADLDEKIPPAFPLYLFTGSSLKNFRGNRPNSSLDLNWRTYIDTDSVSVSINGAYLISPDSARLIMTNSRPSSTFYTTQDISVNKNQNPDFQITGVENTLLVSFHDSKPVSIDTSTIRVSIFTDSYLHDASYLQAAVEAIQQFSGRKIKVTVINNAANIPLKQDWLFWLSAQPLKNIDNTNNILTYEKGKEQTVHSWLTAKNIQVVSQRISLYKYAGEENADPGLQEAIWEDGFSHPVLTKENKNSTAVYHFFSHFDPSWNDLPWSSDFPALIYQLLINKPADATVTDSSDRRIIDHSQVQPVLDPAAKLNGKEYLMQTTDLANYFWSAIFILFFLERLVSFQNKKGKANG